MAQSPQSSLFGTVVDQSGAALADVRIEAVQEDVRFVRTAYSQRTGDFALARLSPGRYTVTATGDSWN